MKNGADLKGNCGNAIISNVLFEMSGAFRFYPNNSDQSPQMAG